MKNQKDMITKIKEGYLIVTLIVLGVLAGISALLIMWPALAYLAAALFV